MAQAAGIQVVSFNSGAADHDSTGSLIDVGLDDFSSGVRAGDGSDEAGVAALVAFEAAEAEIALASFGFSDALADAVGVDEMLIVVWNHTLAQGELAVSAMGPGRHA